MKIKEIQLLSNNLVETEQFYNHILDIKTTAKTDHQISFAVGATKVTFIKSTESIHPNYHLAFDIPTNKLYEAFAWLKENTTILPVTADSDIAEIKLWNAKSFYFYDNNGNLLELICRYDNPNLSNAPFNGSSILYVSEIGIVSENVPELATTLITKYGLDYYAKQPKQDNFMALGNEDGLFILVDQNRNWFPTSKKAEAFWASIKFNLESHPDDDLVIDTKGA
jgi:catechol-2,3-dioxygenase